MWEVLSLYEKRRYKPKLPAQKIGPWVAANRANAPGGEKTEGNIPPPVLFGKSPEAVNPNSLGSPRKILK